jgi:hypothetical protein
MVERDFTDEQRYYVDKLRHHHQRLHGSGVVCGLRVTQHNNEACRNRYVCIEPGTAIDCCGREIVVRERECIDITQYKAIKDLIEKKDTGKHMLQICIRYKECPTEEIPVLYDECGCDDNRCAPNRILESYEIDVVIHEEKVLPGKVAGERPKGSRIEAAAAVEAPVDVPGKRPPLDRHEEEENQRCREILWKEGYECRECQSPDCIVLATITDYVAGETILTNDGIDNRTDRRILPSTQTLHHVIECMLKGTSGTGTQGPAGPRGPAGIDGSRWLHGNSAPGAGTGNDGDYYLDTVTYDVFNKAAGLWTKVGNIKGSPGSVGAAGSKWFNASGVPGVSTGADGDYYLDVSNGDVYRKSSGSWQSPVGNIKGPKGDNGANGEGLEKDLTRIVALSWIHGRSSQNLAEIYDKQGKQLGKGLVIAFSSEVRASEIDAEHVFQVLVEHDQALSASGVICRCAIRGTVVPAEIMDKDPSNKRITKAKQIDSPSKAAAFIIDMKPPIGKRINAGNIELWVQLRGDFVIDYRVDKNGKEIPGKAIDAEFVRAELPTGDRPSKSEYGIQGGLFESWFTIEKGI